MPKIHRAIHILGANLGHLPVVQGREYKEDILIGVLHTIRNQATVFAVETCHYLLSLRLVCCGHAS